MLLLTIAPLCASGEPDGAMDECSECHGSSRWFYIEIDGWPEEVPSDSSFDLEVVIRAKSSGGDFEVSNIEVRLDTSRCTHMSLQSGESATKQCSDLAGGKSQTLVWRMQSSSGGRDTIGVLATGDVHYDHSNPTYADDETVSYTEEGTVLVGTEFIEGVEVRSPPVSLLRDAAILLALAFVFDSGFEPLHRRVKGYIGGWCDPLYYLFTIGSIIAGLIFVGSLAAIQGSGNVGVPGVDPGTVSSLSWGAGLFVLLAGVVGIYALPVLRDKGLRFKGVHVHVGLAVLAVLVSTYAFLYLTGGTLNYVGWVYGRILGVVSLLALLASIVTGAPTKPVKVRAARYIKGSKRVWLHCQISLAILTLALLHALLLLASFYRGQTTGVLDGTVLVLMMVALGYLGMNQRKLVNRYSYKLWRDAHRLLCAATLVGVLLHAIWFGTDFAFLRWW